MPGPFPGMDPYLEAPALWPGLHNGLIFLITETLNALLPPGFKARMNERCYIMQPERIIYPDVAVIERPTTSVSQHTGSSVAVMEDPPILFIVDTIEVREVYIEILASEAPYQVVTVIELLSHSNKSPGRTGRDLYLTKQQEVLESTSNLLEIDLLRTGTPTLAPYRYDRPPAKAGDYLIALHRGANPGHFILWPFRVQQRLPIFHVPLTADLPNIVVDFQPLFDRCYDSLYSGDIDYAQAPYFPLESNDDAWADVLLREKGFR
ncbi:MAG TPA: DUF4058 family protein [Chthonomonadaceae bacterium]|nr:DUF4058 family protein [Chthonomonadaceae bacterium]